MGIKDLIQRNLSSGFTQDRKKTRIVTTNMKKKQTKSLLDEIPKDKSQLLGTVTNFIECFKTF